METGPKGVGKRDENGYGRCREKPRVASGGTFVLADSVQINDSPEFGVAMENFRRVFHEPYYRDYISDDIPARLASAGFEAIKGESHFMTRVWTARKPLVSAL